MVGRKNNRTNLTALFCTTARVSVHADGVASHAREPPDFRPPGPHSRQRTRIHERLQSAAAVIKFSG